MNCGNEKRGAEAGDSVHGWILNGVENTLAPLLKFLPRDNFACGKYLDFLAGLGIDSLVVSFIPGIKRYQAS